MKSILKWIPIDTILGFLFPKIEAALQNVKSNPNPENYVALGEAVAEAGAAQFAPDQLAKVQEYEALAAPLITATISAIEQPSVTSVELAITEAVGIGAKLLNTKATPDEIKVALANLLDVINKEIA